MERNTRITSDKTGSATVVGRLEDGSVIVDADLSDSQILTLVYESELELMETADELRKKMTDLVLDARAELQDVTENYWSKFLADVVAIFKQKWAYLVSTKNATKARIMSIKADMTAKIAEYNSGRRY